MQESSHHTQAEHEINGINELDEEDRLLLKSLLRRMEIYRAEHVSEENRPSLFFSDGRVNPNTPPRDLYLFDYSSIISDRFPELKAYGDAAIQLLFKTISGAHLAEVDAQAELNINGKMIGLNHDHATFLTYSKDSLERLGFTQTELDEMVKSSIDKISNPAFDVDPGHQQKGDQNINLRASLREKKTLQAAVSKADQIPKDVPVSFEVNALTAENYGPVTITTLQKT